MTIVKKALRASEKAIRKILKKKQYTAAEIEDIITRYRKVAYDPSLEPYYPTANKICKGQRIPIDELNRYRTAVHDITVIHCPELEGIGGLF
jgi:hypothetical protein